MADISISVSRPAVSASVTVNPPPNVPVDVTASRRQVSVQVNALAPTDLVQDLSPQLGGDLDLNNHTILGLLDCGLLG